MLEIFGVELFRTRNKFTTRSPFISVTQQHEGIIKNPQNKKQRSSQINECNIAEHLFPRRCKILVIEKLFHIFVTKNFSAVFAVLPKSMRKKNIKNFTDDTIAKVAKCKNNFHRFGGMNSPFGALPGTGATKSRGSRNKLRCFFPPCSNCRCYD